MQQQLDLWPTAQKKPCQQGPWKSLSREERAESIAILARLIAKVICPTLIKETPENRHEQ